MTERSEGLRVVEAEIGRLVRRVKRMIGERAASVHPELQGMSYLILGWIKQNGPARASAIVEAFRIDKGALSRHLQHLDDLGLIVRTPDPCDGRASLVEISTAGNARITEVDDAQRRLNEQLLDDWSVAEIEELGSQLKRYNAALD
ncbi:MarR family transcriptional regulator [Nocardioides sp.]|uniref:MarR family winged helix-turn-helix transcriptional regulator n=1 Tax=Nocardioides sp. TaxID=35761 RepID=UPI0026169402|nr:MarR family transcriptional regulator [Nocardioides sp.]